VFEYQFRSFNESGECVEEATGYDTRHQAEEAAERLIGSPTSEIERVEVYTNRFGKHLSTFNR
jgi:hypothetical protein